MDTLNVTGLPKEKVRFLEQLIAEWQDEVATGPTKINRADLPPLPSWWERAIERAKGSPLAKMSEKEIGQLTEELAERGRQRRLAEQAG